MTDLVHSRVDHPDTTLQTIVESTLTTTTGKDLGFDDHVIVTWQMCLV